MNTSHRHYVQRKSDAEKMYTSIYVELKNG